MNTTTKYNDWRDKDRFEEDMRLILGGGPCNVNQECTRGKSYYESIVKNQPYEDVIGSWSEHHEVHWAECAGKSPEELVEFLETQRAIWLVKASA